MHKHRIKRKPKKWIQKTHIAEHKGALHRMLGIPVSEKIPLATLKRASHASGKLGHRARMALVLRGLPHHHGPR
jgi:hypothetical protein